MSYIRTPEIKEEMRKKAIAQWEDPVIRKKCVKALQKDDKWKEKIGVTVKNNYDSGKVIHPMLGKHQSEESKEKTSQGVKDHNQEDRFETHHYDEDPDNSDPRNLRDVYRSMHKRIHRMRKYLQSKYKTKLIFS